MAFPVSNVVISSDTFSVWVERTNTLCDLFTREAVTANSLANGALTTGNSFVNGIFSAQTFAVNVGLRGGNVAAGANLAIISNAVFTGAVVNVTSNVAIYDSNVYVNTTSFNLVGGIANLTSNVSVINSNTSINAAIMYVVGGLANVTSNVSIAAANVFVNATAASLTGTLLSITSNVASTQANITLNTTAVTHVGATLSSTANVTITGNLHAVSGNVSFDSGTLFVDQINNRVGMGNTAPDASLAVTGTANISGPVRLANTLTSVGPASFSNTVSIANTVTINTEHVIDVFSNNDLGATTGSPVTVYSFDKTAYTTVKFLTQVRSADNANTQGNEMILTHNGTTSTVTVYGTVAAPSAANLGVFSTSINSTAVALNFAQSGASSKVKVVAHFIK